MTCEWEICQHIALISHRCLGASEDMEALFLNEMLSSLQLKLSGVMKDPAETAVYQQIMQRHYRDSWHRNDRTLLFLKGQTLRLGKFDCSFSTFILFFKVSRVRAKLRSSRWFCFDVTSVFV